MTEHKLKILNLQEAARFLKMAPEVLRRNTANGKIPGAKLVGRWVFLEYDLAEYIRSFYASNARVLQGAVNIKRNKTWRSTKEVIRGGSQLQGKAVAYNKLLGLRTK